MSASFEWTDERRAEFMELAARIFRCEASALTPQTSYESIPGWDSVNHLRLVMEAEEALGISYPIEVIPNLRTIGDFFIHTS